MRLSRAAKSGRFALRCRRFRGGGESRATTLPRLLMLTASPSSTQFKTLPKACRNFVTVAFFMANNNAIYFDIVNAACAQLSDCGTAWWWFLGKFG
jgi:hypothetical protein